VADAVGIDPEAPRPPVGFRVHVPDEWNLVDLEPATASSSIDGFLDDAVRRAPAAAPYRLATRRQLLDVVAQSRAGGVFLLAFLATSRGPDDPVGASLTLAWRRLDVAAHLGPHDLALALAQSLATAPYSEGETRDARSVVTVELPSGFAAHLRTVQLVPVPRTTTKRRVAMSQLMLPVPGRSWIAVVTATTPNLDLAAGVNEIALGVTGSIVFMGDQPPSGTVADSSPSSAS
jgi:hypothetical protein